MSEQQFRVQWTAAAQRDLDEIVAYIAMDSPGAALRIVDRIEAKAESLVSLPHRGRIVPELERIRIRSYRELIIPPHRLLYRIRGDVVYVLGIFDSRRNLEDVILTRLLAD